MRQSRKAIARENMSRRELIKSASAIAGAFAIPGIVGTGAAAADPNATVKVVPEVDLKVLDPIWTTALITGTHGYLVYDTLFAPDRQQRVHPQMVDKYERDEDGLTWHFKLRDGLGWHDGTPVTARDCVASIRRWAARSATGKVMMERAERLDALDDNSFILRLKEPFSLVLQTLGRGPPATFMMRAKDAETDPFTQITTAIGSGPFVFLPEEWRPGARVVYRRNPHYRPRSEPASGYAGGKIAKVERVEWTIIPDSATATAALITGEVDYLTNPVVDNVPLLRGDPNIAIDLLDPLGWQFHIRMNALAKPFDDAKARQGLLMLVASQQEAYLAAAGMTGELGKVCLAPFVCGSPAESMIGTGPFSTHDPGKIQSLFKEAGYKGEPLVLMDPTDQSNLHMLAQVLNEHMKRVGLNVDLQAMDWSTLVSRRAVKTPPAAGGGGGWHIFPTAWPSAIMMDPFINPPLDTSCDGKNWFGWPCDAELAQLRLAYIAAKTNDERRQTIETIQRRFFEAAPYAYAGQYFPPIAYRKDRLRGIVGLAAPVYWNMEKFAG